MSISGRNDIQVKCVFMWITVCPIEPMQNSHDMKVVVVMVVFFFFLTNYVFPFTDLNHAITLSPLLICCFHTSAIGCNDDCLPGCLAAWLEISRGSAAVNDMCWPLLLLLLRCAAELKRNNPESAAATSPQQPW